MHIIKSKWLVTICVTMLLSCQQESSDGELIVEEKQAPLASDAAQFLDFTWEGEVVGSSSSTYDLVNEQLMWTIGQLNGDKSVGRIDHVDLTDVTRVGSVVSYRAKMVVAWGKSEIPESYTFHLPRNGTYSGLSSFLAKYKENCMGDTHGDEPTLGDAWYYYRPNNTSCEQDEEDTATFVAEIAPNNSTTTGKYPEYHKVWEDNTLRIVAIFGKNEEDGDAEDVGYKGFNRMVYQVYNMLRTHNVETDPVDIQTESGYYPDVPAPEFTDVEIRGMLPDGKRVVANIFSVPAIRSAGDEFYKRYEAVSAAADFISYNGHSGLGSNIRTLATRGKWIRDQYTIVLMNGCTTFAYVDSALADAHARVNPDDASGDKYLDIFTNARPAYFTANVQGVMAIVNALMSFDNPKTYEQILGGFSISQVALVSGEEDNSYTPQMTVEQKSHFFDDVSLGSKQWKHFGPFSVRPGGIIKVYTGGKHFASEGVLNDADLYVRKGGQPTDRAYDCRSTTPHATEQCVLSGEGQYYVSVFAWTENVNTDFDITVTYQSETAEYCGDGVVSDLETCDGNTLLCTSIDAMYIGGMAECQLTCSGWDESTCLYCGDDCTDLSEICDGNTIACEELNSSYVEGDAICNGTCAGYDQSNCVTGGDLIVAGEEGTVQKDEWIHFGPFTHANGTFKVEMTGTDDADLYVRRGAGPTAKDDDCRPYKSSSEENCSLAGAGQYYISVNGYKTSNGFALTISYRTEKEGVCGNSVVDAGEVCDGSSVQCIDLQNGYTSGTATCLPSCHGFDESACTQAMVEEAEVTESGSLAKGEWVHFGPFENVEGALNAVMTGTGDMDLYVGKGTGPSSTQYDCRPWDSDSDEQCSLEGPASYYVSVYGYNAGNYDLKITYRRAL